MDRLDYERKYSEKTGLLMMALYEMGLIAITCRCGGDSHEDGCEGWNMVSVDSLAYQQWLFESTLYMLP